MCYKYFAFTRISPFGWAGWGFVWCSIQGKRTEKGRLSNCRETFKNQTVSRILPCHFPLKTVPNDPEPILWPRVIWPSGISQSSLESLLPKVFCSTGHGVDKKHTVLRSEILPFLIGSHHFAAIFRWRGGLALPWLAWWLLWGFDIDQWARKRCWWCCRQPRGRAWRTTKG